MYSIVGMRRERGGTLETECTNQIASKISHRPSIGDEGDPFL
jgi:hypothetical protein